MAARRRQGSRLRADRTERGRSSAMTSPTPRTAAGPLRVSTRNPRYFTPPSADGTERAVYLTGSHIWNNLHDGMGPGPVGPADPERFDFDGYLRFLTERGTTSSDCGGGGR